jgi:hypothetical protein
VLTCSIFVVFIVLSDDCYDPVSVNHELARGGGDDNGEKYIPPALKKVAQIVRTILATGRSC